MFADFDPVVFARLRRSFDFGVALRIVLRLVYGAHVLRDV